MTTRMDLLSRTLRLATLARKVKAPLWGAPLALGLVAGLAGCSTKNVGFRPACPSVAIVRDAGLAGFPAADGRLAYTAVISRVDGQCSYDEKGLALTETLRLGASPGAAYTGGPVTVQYFVAVTDPDRKVLAKQIFPVTLDLSQGAAGSVEKINQFIPVGPTTDGRYYEVLVGLQISPDQLSGNIRVNNRAQP